MEREYLGDAVYAEFDGYQIWLHTSNGIFDTNSIALEPETMRKLLDYHKRVEELRNRAIAQR